MRGWLLEGCACLMAAAHSINQFKKVKKMNRFIPSSIVLFAVLMTGCATSQNVTLGQLSAPQSLSSAALVPQEGNSSDMNENMRAAMLSQGLAPQAALPAGTRKSTEVDALVSYTDSWRWDLVMYLRSLTINIFDARSGNLLAMGRWDNSAMHTFPDSKLVTQNLMAEMLGKVKANTAQ